MLWPDEPAYGVLLANAIAAYPRADDLQPRVGSPEAPPAPPSDLSFGHQEVVAPRDSSEGKQTQLAPTIFGPDPQQLPEGAFKYPFNWSNGTGTYQWDAPQIAIDARGTVSPTGTAGGRGSITTTNPHGVASTDFANPQTRQIDRTFYEVSTRKRLGTFPVVPGQTIRLDDGLTAVSFGLPEPPMNAGSSARPSDEIKTIDDLRQAQAQFGDLRQGMDPLGIAHRALDQWAHQIQVPRVGDYMTPSGGADPNVGAIQAAMLNAYVPDSRGTRPATADDFIAPGAALLAPAGELAGALLVPEPTLEELEAILGRAPGLRFEYRTPPLGLPKAEAEARGIPRYDPEIYAHAVAADAEERLAHVVQSIPDEQVVRWGDRIGTHGADVISVNRRTGEVTLWDAKYRGSDVRILHSNTFKESDAPLRINPRLKAIEQASSAIKADLTLPTDIRDKALRALEQKVINTRTVGYGHARNSTFGR